MLVCLAVFKTVVGGFITAWVGSIPTYSRQKHRLNKLFKRCLSSVKEPIIKIEWKTANMSREKAGNNMEAQTNRPNHKSKNHQTSGQCPLYKKCGGCQLQNMTYPEQLRWKQILVERLLQKFCRVEPIIGMENPYHYRNKVQAAFGLTRDKKIISGVYQSSTHRIVPVDDCLIEDKKADEIIVTVRKLIKSFKLQPYNEQRGTGLLRHVLVKRGFSSGQIMVVLVTSTPIFPAKK